MCQLRKTTVDSAELTVPHLSESELNTIAQVIKPCFGMLGPGVISIKLCQSDECTRLVCCEEATEILGGRDDGAKVHYGYKFDPFPLHNIIRITCINMVNDGNGTRLYIKGMTKSQVPVTIEVHNRPPLDAGVGQKLDIRTGEFTQTPPKKGVVAAWRAPL